MSSFKGKSFAVTGASVSVCDIDGNALQKLVDSFQSQKEALHAQRVDLRQRNGVEGWIKETVQRFGRLDGAANLAGVIPESHKITYLADHGDEEWDFVFNVNVKGVMNCMKAELPHLSKGRSIINAGSGFSLRGRDAAAAYSASKHAVVGLTSSVTKEVGVNGITVNCIAPGYISKLIMTRAQPNQPDTQKEDPSNTVLKRFSEAIEVAQLNALLLGDEASFMTGATLCLDGG